MRTRLTGIAVAAALASGTLVTAAASPADAEACSYQLMRGAKSMFNAAAPVHTAPDVKSKIIDDLYNLGDFITGSCLLYGEDKRWRRVVGVGNGRAGYAQNIYLRRGNKFELDY
ncbi:hypothetical protein GT755_36745 [Herbidospora sp. NEAU-GS84]|uniref:SH3 domain-containing protein n=1 Tax=Herbidospora solisilvae TaxID=2696284 RepID=A0A7C9JH38_9ACTN|nr:hypothetical protein [Herbidospora solisilvae]NAS27204.1 hypothetical protein [Herbidospora solisilvae]